MKAELTAYEQAWTIYCHAVLAHNENVRLFRAGDLSAAAFCLSQKALDFAGRELDKVDGSKHTDLNPAQI